MTVCFLHWQFPNIGLIKQNNTHTHSTTSWVMNWVLSARLIQWLGWVFFTQERKKERKRCVRKKLGANMYLHMYIWIYKRICKCTCVYLHTFVHVFIHTRKHICIFDICTTYPILYNLYINCDISWASSSSSLSTFLKTLRLRQDSGDSRTCLRQQTQTHTHTHTYMWNTPWHIPKCPGACFKYHQLKLGANFPEKIFLIWGASYSKFLMLFTNSLVVITIRTSIPSDHNSIICTK